MDKLAKSWSPDELEYLKKNYTSKPIEEVIDYLGRSKDAIQWKASQMGLLIRDGKLNQASYKIVVNVTKEQYDYLNESKNKSAIIRSALEKYMKNE